MKKLILLAFLLCCISLSAQTAVKTDFSIVMQQVVVAYATNFVSLKAENTPADMISSATWKSNLKFKESVRSTVRKASMTENNAWHCVLIEKAPFAKANERYQNVVKEMNELKVDCCALAGQAMDNKVEGFTSYSTLWGVYEVRPTYLTSYSKMFIQLEMTSGLMEDEWTVTLQVFKYWK